MDAAGQLGQHVAPVADFVGADRAVGILARAADEMDGGGKPRLTLRASRLPISVSIGHEPVMIQPASTTACRMASQLAVVLLAKTTMPTPSGRSNSPTFGKCLRHLALVKGDVVRRIAQLVRSINDNLLVFGVTLRV